MTDIYEQIGFGSIPVEFGRSPAILVVDFQAAEIDPGFPLGGAPLVSRAVENTARLLDVARRCNVPVTSCYTAYFGERDMPYWKIPTVREHYFHGSPGTRLDPRIHDPEYDFVVCKSGASMFFQTPVLPYLIRNSVDTIVVTGCSTSGCVRATVIDSFQFGFRTIVPEDCVGDSDQGPHEDNLRDVARRYCDVTSCDEVIREIDTHGASNRPRRSDQK